MLGFQGKSAEVVGADVDEIVYAESREPLLVGKNGFCAFVFIVPRAIAPGFVERAGGFVKAVGRGLEAVYAVPIHGRCFRVDLGGDFVIAERNVIVFAVAETGIDQAVRLVLLDEGVDLLALRGCERHRHIKPSERDFAVFRHDFLDLRQDFISVGDLEILFLFVGEVPGVFPRDAGTVDGLALVAAAVFLMPVEVLRIIDAEFQAVFAAGIGKLLDDITLEGEKSWQL